jgi:hypothetical protein
VCLGSVAPLAIWQHMRIGVAAIRNLVTLEVYARAQPARHDGGNSLENTPWCGRGACQGVIHRSDARPSSRGRGARHDA